MSLDECIMARKAKDNGAKQPKGEGIRRNKSGKRYPARQKSASLQKRGVLDSAAGKPSKSKIVKPATSLRKKKAAMPKNKKATKRLLASGPGVLPSREQ